MKFLPPSSLIAPAPPVRQRGRIAWPLVLGAVLLGILGLPAAASLPAGWTRVDIGTVGMPGAADESGGVFTVQGGGYDIWGSIEEFCYVYQPAKDDCSIVARVTSVEWTNWGANAGIMIRESLGLGSKYVRIALTPSAGTVFHSDNAGSGSSWQGGYAPYWLKLTREGDVFSAYISADGVNWGNPVGTRTLAMGSDVFVGLTVCRHSEDDNVLNTSVFDNVSTTGTVAPATPGGWTDLDIGDGGAVGGSVQEGGVFTVEGAGRQMIWDTNDKCHFVYLPLSGNGTGNGSITARISSQESTHWEAVAGLVMRDNLGPDATSIIMGREPGNRVRFQYHQQGNGWGSSAADPGPAAPCWLRLEREGNAFTGSYSADGVNWTVYGTATLSMPVDIYVGLAVCSGIDGVVNTTVFDNVSTTGTDLLTPGWFSTDLGTVGVAGSAAETSLFTVKGSGAGFWGNSDNGHFVYREINGDGQIVARVGSQENGTASAPAALMIRDSLAAASKNAVLAVSADGILRFQSHAHASDPASTVVSTPGVRAPYWLKLARTGNTLTGYYSADGWNWMPAGSATVALNASASIGLAVSSKDNGQLSTALFGHVSVGPVSGIPPAVTPVLTDITAGLTLIDEIDTTAVPPAYESAAGVSSVAPIAGKDARVMPTAGALGDTAATIAYVIGQNKGLVPGRAYVLTVEYPDDVPRAMYITNRGADYLRGLATGTAVGDAREQFVEASVESMNYPQTGQWQTYKQFFFLLDRFQGVVGERFSTPGYRPYVPADGFHVAITRMKQLNDPRSQGAAVGKIRLYEVADPAALYAPIHYPPPSLPRRSIFWREEMADGLLQSTGNPADNAVADPVTWYLHKMRMAKVLGINTLAKDLLEWGYNQGWETGDPYWTIEAQEPARDLWTRLVPQATAEGFTLLPYFEYKTGIGLYSQGLAQERRAQKLYHGIKSTCGNTAYYQCTWWTEDANGDLTDPDTLVDAKRVLDRTIGDFTSKGTFQGAWFRMRGNHLPMSFAQATIDRFKADHPGDPAAQAASQSTLIASYEGDKALYNQYVGWWFGKRAAFLTALRDHLRNEHGIADAQILFTPWTSEAVVPLHHIGQSYNHAGVVTDDEPWWTNYFNSLPVSWWKYQWQPTPFSQVIADDLYRLVLEERPPINHGMNMNHEEQFHSSPHADPWNYQQLDGVMMTFPTGRLFTLANPALLEEYRCATGLTVVQHFALNEDNAQGTPMPFDGQLGYLSVDCDRAGHHAMLQNARAVAHGDPRNIGYLAASSFSTGFPEIMRRFNQAFLAVPALPSTKLAGASSDTEVVVRQVTTQGHGTYYYVVNTSMAAKTNVTVNLPGSGTVKNLVTQETLPGTGLTLSLDPAELRAYRVGP